MYYTSTIKLSILALSLAFIFIVFSASSCETGSYQQSTGGNDYQSMAYQDAINAGIDPNLFQRQIAQESGFNPNAVSSAGCIGIAQFLPSTAASLGIDPWNAQQSLQGAANLMASYYRDYGYDYAKALSSYNYGPTGTANAIANWGYAWKQHIPSETVNYINTIMG